MSAPPPVTLVSDGAVVSKIEGLADGVFQSAHSMTGSNPPDLKTAQPAPDSTSVYDLVIVGAGVSGLSAAHFYRKKPGNSQKKVLILDPLHNFGGHAQRVEMTDKTTGRTLIGYLGSESFQSPRKLFNSTCNELLADLGINLDKLEAAFQGDTYPALGLSRGVFFPRTPQGKLVVGDPTDMVADDIPKEKAVKRPLEQFIGDFPISDESKQLLIAMFTSKDKVTLSEVGDAAAIHNYLRTTSYGKFIADKWKATEEVVSFLRQRLSDFFGIGIDFLPAFDCRNFGAPGFQGVEAVLPRDEDADAEMNEGYRYHFPDGNSSIARCLVQKLIPNAFPTVDPAAATPEAILTAPLQADQLDNDKNNTRIRLGATAVGVVLPENDHAEDAVSTVFYSHDRKIYRLAAKRVICACFNMLLPYLIKPSNDAQKAQLEQRSFPAFRRNIKAPLVYSTILLKNWHCFAKAGVHEVAGAAGLFHCRIKLDYPVSMGSYKCPTNPNEPILVHMVHVPTKTASEVDSVQMALRRARGSLYSINADGYRDRVFADLRAIFGATGFTDDLVQEIVVGRWSHGYSFVQNSLAVTEAEFAEAEKNAQAPLAGGLLTIANSDSQFDAYLHAAINAGARAVQQLK